MFPDQPTPPSFRRRVQHAAHEPEGDLSSYGLAEPAFDLSPDPRFFFASRSQLETYQQIAEAVKGPASLVTVVGDDGVGKTTLCSEVARRLPAPARVVVVDALTGEDVLVQVIDAVAGAQAVPPAGRDPEERRRQAFETLQQHLTARMREERVVVLVDDADRVRADALEWLLLLSNVASESTELLCVVLVGSPLLEAELRKERFGQLVPRRAVRCRLTALGRSEVASYVAHRLTVAQDDAPGSESVTPRFAPAAIGLLHRATAGIPAAVNRVGARALVLGAAADSAEVTAAMVREAAGRSGLAAPRQSRRFTIGALVAASVLTIAVLTWTRNTADESPQPTGGASAPMPAEPAPVAALPPPPSGAPADPVVAAPPEQNAASTAPATAPPPPSVAAPSIERSIPGPAPATSPTVAPAPTTPAAPRQAQPRVPDVTVPAGAHLVAVGMFRNERNADDITQRLLAKDLPAFIRHDDSRGWHQVYLGPYDTLDEARALLPRLQTEFGVKDATTRREGGAPPPASMPAAPPVAGPPAAPRESSVTPIPPSPRVPSEPRVPSAPPPAERADVPDAPDAPEVPPAPR